MQPQADPDVFKHGVTLGAMTVASPICMNNVMAITKEEPGLQLLMDIAVNDANNNHNTIHLFWGTAIALLALKLKFTFGYISITVND